MVAMVSPGSRDATSDVCGGAKAVESKCAEAVMTTTAADRTTALGALRGCEGMLKAAGLDAQDAAGALDRSRADRALELVAMVGAAQAPLAGA
jgi:hypothetical protein